MLSNLRQLNCLKSTLTTLQNIQTHINNQQTLDIIAIDCRDIINQLSELMGEDFTEELLDGIFSRFCIGK